MRFWDSSAIVALLVPQSASACAEALVNEDSGIVFWWATPVECVSALVRLMREGRMTEDQIEIAKRRLDAILDRADAIDPTDWIRDHACRLLRVHPLRAADALQLAAALELRGSDPDTIDFVTFDARLGAAAKREGLVVP
jgi:uncharacterized protein